jgi:hypothetical protein
MANVALVTPSVIVTLWGTLTMLRRLGVSVTVAPPKGAGALRVSVPTTGLPPAMRGGLSVKEAIVTVFCGATMTLRRWRTPPKLAMTVMAFGAVTVLVVIVNVSLVWFFFTVAEDGTRSDGSLLVRVTALPPLVVAADASVMVPVALLPPTMNCGVTEIEAT